MCIKNMILYVVRAEKNYIVLSPVIERVSEDCQRVTEFYEQPTETYYLFFMYSNFGSFEVSELYSFPIELRGFQKSFRVKRGIFLSGTRKRSSASETNAVYGVIVT